MNCAILLGEKGFIGENAFYLLIGFFLKSQNPIQHHKFIPKYFQTDLRLKTSIL